LQKNITNRKENNSCNIQDISSLKDVDMSTLILRLSFSCAMLTGIGVKGIYGKTLCPEGPPTIH